MASKINYKAGGGFNRHRMVVTGHFLYDCAIRDFEYMQNYGITKEYLENFKETVVKMSKVTVYTTTRAFKTMATAEKNDKLKYIKKALKHIRRKLDLAMDKYAERYRNIIEKPLSKMKQAELINNIFDTYRFLIENNDIAREAFISEKEIEELNTLYVEINAQVSDQSFHIATRSNTSAKMAEFKDIIYKQMLHICKVGKIIWIENDDQARYENYVISRYKKNHTSGRRKKKQ